MVEGGRPVRPYLDPSGTFVLTERHHKLMHFLQFPIWTYFSSKIDLHLHVTLEFQQLAFVLLLLLAGNVVVLVLLSAATVV